MKSRDSSRGIFSPITAAWRWLWAPRKNPHAAEERENQRRREKRRRSSATAAATKTRVSTKPNTAPQTTELAYVDKSGKVRLTEGGRVVARANKGSKAAALTDAKALFELRAAELSALEAVLNAPDALISELEGSVAMILLLPMLSKPVRKPCLEPIIWMISELEGWRAIFLLLITHSKPIRNTFRIIIIL